MAGSPEEGEKIERMKELPALAKEEPVETTPVGMVVEFPNPLYEQLHFEVECDCNYRFQCDKCHGTGFVLTALGEKVLKLMERHMCIRTPKPSGCGCCSNYDTHDIERKRR
jgi:hypothetical protein